MVGNTGREVWNARPQAAEDAQAMLAGATRTIARLLDEIDHVARPDRAPVS